ncbi:hypothetical protein EMPS_07899 [Entomortierella parvispora]|uniref:BZIP domain-containing protein n=1 Tax=Entomortierella parvispora TaxID=205924 RepID=A0A9P3HFB8_9FUNG|nr:hypothetical protein EMPS_07899 [Entomortierella parvispora]
MQHQQFSHGQQQQQQQQQQSSQHHHQQQHQRQESSYLSGGLVSDYQRAMQQFDSLHGFLDSDPRSAMLQGQQQQSSHQITFDPRVQHHQQHQQPHSNLPAIQGYHQQPASSAYLLSSSTSVSHLPLKNRSRHHSVSTAHGSSHSAPQQQQLLPGYQQQQYQLSSQSSESIQRERLQQLEDELEEYAQELADEKRLLFLQKDHHASNDSPMDEYDDEGDGDYGDEDENMNYPNGNRGGIRTDSGTPGTGGNNTPRHSASPSPSSPSSPSMTYTPSDIGGNASGESLGSPISTSSPSTPYSPGAVQAEGMSAAAKQEAEDDKRRRNTAASARFRHKKRLREQILEKTAQEMTAKSDRLQARVRELEMEIKWLRGLVVEKDSRGTLKRSLGVSLGLTLPTGPTTAGVGHAATGIPKGPGGTPSTVGVSAMSNLLSSSLPASLALPSFGSPTSYLNQPSALPFGMDITNSGSNGPFPSSTIAPNALIHQGKSSESGPASKSASRRSKKAQ